MSNERPSNRPGGYWIANTPASAPADVYPSWISEMFGNAVGPDNSDAIPDPRALWPAPTGEGLPAWERADPTYEVRRAAPTSLADMVAPGPVRTAANVLPESDQDVRDMRELAEFYKAQKAGTLEPIPDAVSQRILEMGRAAAAKRRGGV